MKTAATATQTSGTYGWMRVVLLAACLALLAAAAPPRNAAAEPVNPRSAMQTQKAVCEALGGVADTEQQQIAGSGVDIATKTTCKGGLLDGMTCTNALVNDSTKCSMSLTQPDDGPVWHPIGEDIPTLEQAGTLTLILRNTADVNSILAGLEAGLSFQEIFPSAEAGSPAGQDVVAPDDLSPDKHTSKGKAKGKKGKKGGKGRK